MSSRDCRTPAPLHSSSSLVNHRSNPAWLTSTLRLLGLFHLLFATALMQTTTGPNLTPSLATAIAAVSAATVHVLLSTDVSALQPARAGPLAFVWQLLLILRPVFKITGPGGC